MRAQVRGLISERAGGRGGDRRRARAQQRRVAEGCGGGGGHDAAPPGCGGRKRVGSRAAVRRRAPQLSGSTPTASRPWGRRACAMRWMRTRRSACCRSATTMRTVRARARERTDCVPGDPPPSRRSGGAACEDRGEARQALLPAARAPAEAVGGRRGVGVGTHQAAGGAAGKARSHALLACAPRWRCPARRRRRVRGRRVRGHGRRQR